MSRYALPAHDPTLTVTVGWDPPLQTFFGQVLRPATAADADDVLAAWMGTRPQEIATVAQLCTHLSPYADIPVATQARLAQDQVESLPLTALQTRLVHLLEELDQQRGDGRAEPPSSATAPRQAFAQRWWSIATHPLQAFAAWFTPRFRPEAHRQFLIADTEGPVTVERAGRDAGPPERPEASVVASDDTQRFYSMSPAEHADWARGGAAASAVERRLWDALQQAGQTGRLEVLTPTGAPAFHLDLSAPQRSIGADGPDDVRLPRELGPAPGSVEAALLDVRLEDNKARAEQEELVHEAPRALLEQIAALRDRLGASPEALQPTRQRDQGMGR